MISLRINAELGMGYPLLRTQQLSQALLHVRLGNAVDSRTLLTADQLDLYAK
jgi:hypothetical protein